MKRRGFLRLLGSALVAPLVPVPAIGAAPAAYSRTAWHGAIIHAQTRSAFSIFGLATALNVPLAQAEAIMADLAERGITGPLQGATFGGRWATSKVLLSEKAALAQATRNMVHGLKSGEARATGQADLSPLMTHLRKVADRFFAQHRDQQPYPNNSGQIPSPSQPIEGEC